MPTELSGVAIERLHAELLRWKGTPYSPGQQMAGACGGANCVMFVDAALRAYTGRKTPLPPRNAEDSSLHSPESVRAMMRHFLAHYPSERLPDYWVARSMFMPGDVLAVSTSDELFHIGIVGLDRREFWHASWGGVDVSSVQAIPSMGWRIREAFRPILPEVS